MIIQLTTCPGCGDLCYIDPGYCDDCQDFMMRPEVNDGWWDSRYDQARDRDEEWRLEHE
jgi:hypothetical protein